MLTATSPSRRTASASARQRLLGLVVDLARDPDAGRGVLVADPQQRIRGGSARWTAFIASSETITDTASRGPGGTEPIAARTNRRAAGMESASGGKVSAVLMG
jgi:hypothetical protein